MSDQTKYLACAFAAALEVSLLQSAQSSASSVPTNQNPANYPTTKTMEKCRIVGPDGRGLINEGMTDCATTDKQPCAGHNDQGDPASWIYIPAGICEKIKGGIVVR